jgi:hypothetical protein
MSKQFTQFKANFKANALFLQISQRKTAESNYHAQKKKSVDKQRVG